MYQQELFKEPKQKEREYEKWWGKSKKGASVMTAKHPLYHAVQEDPFKGAYPIIPAIADRPFAVLAGWFAMGKGREIMFNFHITPDLETPLARQILKYCPEDKRPSHIIDYVAFVKEAESGPGSVSISSDASARQDAAQSVRTNGQGHTHPGIRAWWSSTDLTDHARDLNLATAFIPQGERFFIVMDGCQMLLRRYRWWETEGGTQLRYADTYVRNSMGQPLDNNGNRYWEPSKKHSGWGGVTIVTTDPSDLLAQMETDADLHTVVTPDETRRLFNYLAYTYGETIFTLPIVLNEDRDDLLKVVNSLIFVLSQYGYDWDDVFHHPELWIELFGKEVS